MLTDKLIEECGQAIMTLAQEVASTKVGDSKSVILLPSEFLTSYPDTKLKSLIDWSKESPKSKFIYVFSVQSERTPEELLVLFREAKRNEKQKSGKRSFARDIQASKTLYVGSSSSIGTRIGQHLGHKNETVYSMQLRHWLKPDSVTSLKIDVWKFSSDTSQSVLQAIEDHLWSRAQPTLGKQGGK